MATIYSAVRAYSIEDVAVLRESAIASGGAGLMLASETLCGEASPATMMSRLNHQLYEVRPRPSMRPYFWDCTTA